MKRMDSPPVPQSAPVRRGELRAALASLRGAFASVTLFSMVANLLMLVPTLYMLQVYDRVLVSQNELTLIAVTLMTVFLLGIGGFSEWARTRLLVRVGVRLDDALAARSFDAGFAADAGRRGVRSSRVLDDLVEVRQFVTGTGVLCLLDAPWMPIYLAVLFVLHPFLGIVAIAFALLQLTLAWFGHRRIGGVAREASRTLAEENAFVQAKLANAEVVESMGMLGGLRRRWRERHVATAAAQTVVQGRSERITAVSKFTRYAQQSLALGAGALLVIDGELSPGAMIAANVLMTRALAPIDQLVSAWRGVAGAREAWGRLDASLDARPSAEPLIASENDAAALVLRGVTATAPQRPTPILDGIDLQADPGSVTVILGPSGSGKSTLARAMLGIWPDLRGDVKLGGISLAGVDRVAIGPRIGYLPQDVELFDATVAENIARLSAPDPEAVVAAAKAAGLHEMILRLPAGYDTRIGLGGVALSGGQRQRVALARALYGEPALVVLDEPNANLDEAGETALADAVRGLKERGATVVLITHRPGAITLADQLVVLAGGRIGLQGPRDVVLTQMKEARERAALAMPRTAQA